MLITAQGHLCSHLQGSKSPVVVFRFQEKKNNKHDKDFINGDTLNNERHMQTRETYSILLKNRLNLILKDEEGRQGKNRAAEVMENRD